MKNCHHGGGKPLILKLRRIMEGGKPLILKSRRIMEGGKPLILKSRRIVKGENPSTVSMIDKENQNKSNKRTNSTQIMERGKTIDTKVKENHEMKGENPFDSFNDSQGEPKQTKVQMKEQIPHKSSNAKLIADSFAKIYEQL